MREILYGFFLVSGTFFLTMAAVGLLRFPDVFCKMHAVSKASTLGFAGIILGTVFYFGQDGITFRALIAIAFQFLTIPVSTHLLARTAYKIKTRKWEHTRYDHPEGDIEFSNPVGKE